MDTTQGIRHVDFAALTQHKSSVKNVSSLDVAQVDANRMQLISPPPEEILSLRRVSGLRINSNPTPVKAQPTTETPASSVSKRKRGPPTPVKLSSSSATATIDAALVHETTPNPKPRKHVRTASVESPTRESFGSSLRPTAKLVDKEMLETTPTKPKKTTGVKSPIVLTSEDTVELETEKHKPAIVRQAMKARSRRSATPIPPYEPPRDIFTPPREVFLKPLQPKSVSKSSKRKSLVNARAKGLRVDTKRLLHTQVKQELPDDLDLLAPMPPPSPTDDPLLLKGRPKPQLLTSERNGAKEQKGSASVEIQTELGVAVTSDYPLPSSPETSLNTDEVEPIQLDWDQGQEDAGSPWSDSDDEAAQLEGEGEGTYTGKWRMMRIPMKQDPPSSTTRMRQEIWGRPISPFPKQAKLDLLGEELVEEEEVREMSLEPEGREDTDTDDDDLGLVKITSVDPRAAARAVAILKQHDYDCFTKIVKKRRASYSTADDFAKETRRRSASGSGITKLVNRRSTMGVIGDKVIIPGSPIMTLPELLQEVEKDVAHNSHDVWSGRTCIAGQVEVRDPFKTPWVNKFRDFAAGPASVTPVHYPAGERGWTKGDWKVLDACFTDIRLDRGGPESGMLALVDLVSLEDVVSRFVDLMGGQPLVDTFGESWTRDNILERVRALVKKQSSGHIAPPTTPATSLSFTSPSPSYPSSATFGCLNQLPTLVGLDLTPLGRGVSTIPKSPLSRPPISAAVVEDAPFQKLALANESQRKVPPSLLAPRYSHLLEEATAFEKHDPMASLPRDDEGTEKCQLEGIVLSAMSQEEIVTGNACDPDVIRQDHCHNSVTQFKPAILLNRQPTSTLTNRVRGFFTSYLPTLSRRPQSQQKSLKATQLCLPLPPPSVLEKTRGPVSTPLRPPLPRIPHPKELVQLNPAPLPPSHIPRAKLVPKRLVDLVPVMLPPQEPKSFKTQFVPRPRRSSGSSVKDLVKGFEQMEKNAVQETESVEDLRLRRQDWCSSKPKWKP